MNNTSLLFKIYYFLNVNTGCRSHLKSWNVEESNQQNNGFTITEIFKCIVLIIILAIIGCSSFGRTLNSTFGIVVLVQSIGLIRINVPVDEFNVGDAR